MSSEHHESDISDSSSVSDSPVLPEGSCAEQPVEEADLPTSQLAAAQFQLIDDMHNNIDSACETFCDEIAVLHSRLAVCAHRLITIKNEQRSANVDNIVSLIASTNAQLTTISTIFERVQRRLVAAQKVPKLEKYPTGTVQLLGEAASEQS